MPGQLTNLGLLGLLAVALGTGGLAYATGTAWGRWVVLAHGAAGLGLLLLAPWKSVIVRRGLRRRGAARGAPSLALLVLVVLTVVTGVVHAAGVRGLGIGVTAMQVHVGAALGAVPLVVWHLLTRPVAARGVDLDRRTVLRTGALAAGSAAAWYATEGLFSLAGAPGDDRRFTGSHERGSFEPAAMPVTQWFDDDVPLIDGDTWSLSVSGPAGGPRRWTLADLAALADDDGADHVEATLDCTGGWWAMQRWEGVALDRLLPAGGSSIRVESATGYWRRFPRDDARHLLLATRVGGEPLSAGHGFPARIVAPGRRGFWWVKWVVRIDVDGTPWWWQPPYPLS